MVSVKDQIRLLQYEMGVSGRLMRARAVEEQLTDIEAELVERRERLELEKPGSFEYGMNTKMTRALIAHRKKLVSEFEYALSVMIEKKRDDTKVTDSEIERARTYPIENLLDVKRGVAQCISGSHKDNHPSMDVRNGFAYCYTCGWTGDVLSVYQKLNGGSFVDAVKALQ